MGDRQLAGLGFWPAPAARAGSWRPPRVTNDHERNRREHAHGLQVMTGSKGICAYRRLLLAASAPAAPTPGCSRRPAGPFGHHRQANVAACAGLVCPPPPAGPAFRRGRSTSMRPPPSARCRWRKKPPTRTGLFGCALPWARAGVAKGGGQCQHGGAGRWRRGKQWHGVSCGLLLS